MKLDFRIVGIVLLLLARGAGAQPAQPVPEVKKSFGNVSSTTEMKLGGTIWLAVQNLPAWRKDHDVTTLRLYLNDHLISSVKPAVPGASENYVTFPVTVMSDDREAWVPVLLAARNEQPIKVGIGDSKAEFPTELSVKMTVYPKYTWGVIVVLIAVVCAVLFLGSRSNLLRYTTGGAPAAGTPRFSLNLVQIAWWFVIVVCSYVYLWLITGNYCALNQQVLVLLGISAATTVAASTVDSDKSSRGVAAFGAAASGGWLRDIISDNTGVALERLQVVVWTAILGCMFIVSVLRDLAMPVFDTNTLALMGISSGTYVGLKMSS